MATATSMPHAIWPTEPEQHANGIIVTDAAADHPPSAAATAAEPTTAPAAVAFDATSPLLQPPEGRWRLLYAQCRACVWYRLQLLNTTRLLYVVLLSALVQMSGTWSLGVGQQGYFAPADAPTMPVVVNPSSLSALNSSWTTWPAVFNQHAQGTLGTFSSFVAIDAATVKPSTITAVGSSRYWNVPGTVCQVLNDALQQLFWPDSNNVGTLRAGRVDFAGSTTAFDSNEMQGSVFMMTVYATFFVISVIFIVPRPTAATFGVSAGPAAAAQLLDVLGSTIPMALSVVGLVVWSSPYFAGAKEYVGVFFMTILLGVSVAAQLPGPYSSVAGGFIGAVVALGSFGGQICLDIMTYNTASKAIMPILFPTANAVYWLTIAIGDHSLLPMPVGVHVLLSVLHIPLWALASEYFFQTIWRTQRRSPFYLFSCCGQSTADKRRAARQSLAPDESAENNNAIKIRDLVHEFPSGDKAVNGLCVDITRGEIVALLGANGAGKSTTMNILGGSLTPTSYSRCEVDGVDVGEDPDALARSVIAYGQNSQYSLEVRNTLLNVKQNLEYCARLRGVPATRVEYLMDVFKLPKGEAKELSFSKGQLQHYMLALALVADHPVLLLDEPSSGLDPEAKRLMWDVLKAERARGKTILITTHSLDEAEALGDRVAIMANGSMQCIDTPLALKARFGVGYKMTVTAPADDDDAAAAGAGRPRQPEHGAASSPPLADPWELLKICNKFCNGGACVVSRAANSCVIMLPVTALPSFGDMLLAVEAHLDAHARGCTYAIDANSLEDVYVKLIETASTVEALEAEVRAAVVHEDTPPANASSSSGVVPFDNMVSTAKADPLSDGALVVGGDMSAASASADPSVLVAMPRPSLEVNDIGENVEALFAAACHPERRFFANRVKTFLLYQWMTRPLRRTIIVQVVQFATIVGIYLCFTATSLSSSASPSPQNKSSSSSSSSLSPRRHWQPKTFVYAGTRPGEPLWRNGPTGVVESDCAKRLLREAQALYAPLNPVLSRDVPFKYFAAGVTVPSGNLLGTAAWSRLNGVLLISQCSSSGSGTGGFSVQYRWNESMDADFYREADWALRRATMQLSGAVASGAAAVGAAPSNVDFYYRSTEHSSPLDFRGNYTPAFWQQLLPAPTTTPPPTTTTATTVQFNRPDPTISEMAALSAVRAAGVFVLFCVLVVLPNMFLMGWGSRSNGMWFQGVESAEILIAGAIYDLAFLLPPLLTFVIVPFVFGIPGLNRACVAAVNFGTFLFVIVVFQLSLTTHYSLLTVTVAAGVDNFTVLRIILRIIKFASLAVSAAFMAALAMLGMSFVRQSTKAGEGSCAPTTTTEIAGWITLAGGVVSGAWTPLLMACCGTESRVEAYWQRAPEERPLALSEITTPDHTASSRAAVAPDADRSVVREQQRALREWKLDAPVSLGVVGLKKVYRVLAKSNPNGDGVEVRPRMEEKVVLAGLSLAAGRGECVALLGTNGAGKSTTLHAATRMLVPDAGTAFIAGLERDADIQASRYNLTKYYRAARLGTIHHVGESSLSPAENLDFYLRFRLGPHYGHPSHWKEYVQTALASVDLTDEKLGSKKSTGELSGGMQQRLSLAIAAHTGAQYLILDEPTSNMDPYACRQAWDVVNDFKRQRERGAVILATHNMAEADAVGDRVAIMHKGALRAVDAPATLKARFASGYCVTVHLVPRVQQQQPPQQPAAAQQQQATAHNRRGNQPFTPEGPRPSTEAAAAAQAPDESWKKEVDDHMMALYGEYGCKLVEEHGFQRRYALPDLQSPARLFQTLAAEKVAWGVETYSVTRLATLEHVFKRITASGDEDRPATQPDQNSAATIQVGAAPA